MIINIGIKTLASILVSYFFAVLFNVQGKKIIYSGIAGGICWIVYDTVKLFGNTDAVAGFLSAVCLTIYSEFMANKIKTPVTSFLIPGLIPIVPGGGVYYTMFYILEKNPLAREKGIDTLLLSGALSFGVLFVSSIVAVYYRIKQKDVKYVYKKVVKNRIKKLRIYE